MSFYPYQHKYRPIVDKTRGESEKEKGVLGGNYRTKKKDRGGCGSDSRIDPLYR